jgi:6-phosphogluconolactonase
MPPVINIFTKKEWARLSAQLLQEAIIELINKESSCNVMLTGGNSAKDLYLSWVMLPQFHQMENVNFYLGDERCVSFNDPESNLGMLYRTLFYYGVPKNCQVFPMYAEKLSAEDLADHYAEILPDRIDILLLSVGDDGHIASLFPGDSALHETRLVVPVLGPKPPRQRITITPEVFLKTKSIYVLAIGNHKYDIFTNLVKSDGIKNTPPAALVLNATWILCQK